MAITLADAFVRIRPDVTGTGKAIESGVKKEVGEAGTTIGRHFADGFKLALGGLSAAGLGLGVVDFFKGMISEATEAAKVNALTAAVLKSTGEAAKVSAGQVGDLANRLSLLSGVDDEVIQSGENVLLTFTSIRNGVGKGNDVFNQATAAALDMSKALGQDLQSSVTQVGKALNDPIQGMTALRRVGVSFTEEQVKQITALQKSGNLMGAQKVILGELSKEFGGAAAAAATPAEKMHVAWGNFQEMLGGAVLPTLSRLMTLFVGGLLPIVQGKLLPAIRDLAGWFQLGFLDGASHVSGLAGVMQVLGAAVRGVWDWVRTTGLPAAKELFAILASAIGVVANVVTWFNEHRKMALALGIAMGALVVVTKAHAAVLAVEAAGGLVKYIAQINIVKTVTTAWTAVQWLLDAALNANPIGLIVIALAALAAAIYLAWTHSATFRTIVIDTWHAIEVAVKFAWTDVIKPVVEALVWFWRNVLGPTVMWLWRNVIYPAWQAIGLIIQVAWAIIKPILAVLGVALQVLGTVFMWLWKNVIQPVWQGIQIAISVAWAIIEVIFGLIQIAIKSAAAGFLWLWQNVVYPAWQAIQLIISAAWAVIRPVLAAAEWFIRNVLAPVFGWLWHNIIEPIFKGIGQTISFVWDNVIKPVFNVLGRFITDTVEPAFKAGVDALGKAWHGLLEMAKAPVKFIIETVLNDGLLGAYNWIASKFGVHPDNVHVSLPKGFATGGYTGPGSRDQPAGIVHAGEYVIPADRTARYLPLLEAVHRGEVPGYADGGLVGWLKSGWNAITDPVKWLKDKALGLLDHIPGGRWIADQVIGAGKSLIGGAVEWLKKEIASLFGSAGGPTGPGPGFPPWPSSPSASRGDSGVWQSIVDLVRGTGIPYTFGNAYRAGDPLWHGSGRAVDLMGFNQDRLAGFFMGIMPRVLELIHRSSLRDYAVTRGVNRGSFNNELMEQHRNHVHIAMDSGYGVLAPGANLVTNGTGRPEPIAALARLGGPMELTDATIEKLGRAIGREINRTGASVIQLARAT